ncbi:Dot/Icm secretion system protein IcmQ [Legionella taurinensis]|uniref:Dot/Icm secretion system protein IcmQ n=1 Tax=Legionella taurinensis TaxID=70611 RepID=A0AB38N6J8_9GAMM|nr:Dot/Icm secretion system protein IcmQ [Legionella taurinensis]MDX1837503.1 Dot/Icm secretion system protein IcmQ [Legionella taurinensis]PUT40844.1 Dot/Icm secretion system protein IcmQ [Legionella taurinensis]PUT44265.1 Dot/Icm secretion system protein IcmQ [Legionella taurinensis]PUT47567.1 Dot/Icm secretion system protein IcmQ [Legionella taurinensis]PUT48706.1 Dot/Icm secretion system protein IcmQ [Legionella taurinensis]
MRDDDVQEQIDILIKTLNEAIDNGPWEDSNFLRVVGKNLREIRDNFIRQVGLSPEEKLKSAVNALQRNLHNDQQLVFVSLYSSEGQNLQSWERIIANLQRQIISRPIYADEADIVNLIKSKEKKINEAYLAIFINQSDLLLLPPDKTPLDKLGRPLITLKDKAINLDNIVRFVHFSGVYTYLKGRLIKNPATESDR